MTDHKAERKERLGYFFSNVAVSVIGHPVEYAKVLIQVRLDLVLYLFY